MEDSYLLDGLVDLVESDVEVELLLLEGGALLVVQLHKVLQEVKVRNEDHSASEVEITQPEILRLSVQYLNQIGQCPKEAGAN